MGEWKGKDTEIKVALGFKPMPAQLQAAGCVLLGLKPSPKEGHPSNSLTRSREGGPFFLPFMSAKKLRVSVPVASPAGRWVYGTAKRSHTESSSPEVSTPERDGKGSRLQDS